MLRSMYTQLSSKYCINFDILPASGTRPLHKKAFHGPCQLIWGFR